MTGKEFQEILKTIACLGYDEFMLIYKELAPHIWMNHVVGKDRLSFLLRVDEDCAQKVLDYVNTKIAKRG